MALDTQPLSVGRRALMVVVLLAFFGGSLGFAQWLVSRRQGKVILTVDLGRFGFVAPVAEEFPDEFQGRMGVVEGHARRVDVFEYEVAPTGSATRDIVAATSGVKELFLEMMGDSPGELKLGDIGGMKGVEATGGAEDGRILWIRMALFGGHAGAICYSGVGPFTDADRKVFEELCVSGVRFGESGR